MSDGKLDKIQWRFRLLTCCVALTTLAFIQQPGRIVTDTKLDLVANPGGFLERALSFWDSSSAFGQVQNQAYGYLFPMGSFFWVGKAVHLEPWITQRLWWSLLLCIAFLGMVKLCKVLDVASPAAILFAGFAFALSPRILTGLGASSIEVWPSALAPWVLIPLVIGVKTGNPRKLAGLSALAVACVGGVNAAATFAVIPLGALWLLMSAPGPRRRSLMWWWPGFVLLGTLWWLVPLFLLGAYTPPFLDFIESSSITTTAATPFDALRGTTNWVPYISGNSIAGKELLSDPLLILNGGIILVLGFVGLAHTHVRHRTFLVSGLFLGLAMVTAGHVDGFAGWGSASIQQALDGVLAPLRNTHKFDVVVRIPLVVGCAYLLSKLFDQKPAPHRDKATAEGKSGAVRVIGFGLFCVVALAGAVAPAWSGQLANRGSFDGIPDYWQETAAWLNKNSDGTSLLVPASAFPEYVWGNSGDEPLQPLSSSPWAVRNSVPLAQSGNIRFLDAVMAELAEGRKSSGIAATLRRAGVSYLVVRNDLRSDVTQGRSEAVYRTIEESEGLTKVTSFGPKLGGDPNIDLGSARSFSNGGWQSSHPAVDIFSVDDGANSHFQSVDGTPTVVGGPESLTLLDSLGLSTNTSVILAPDQRSDAHPESLMVTDGFRRQEAAFGSVANNKSASLSTRDHFVQRRRVHDYLEPGDKRWLSVPILKGARSLTASSSRSDVSQPGGVRPGNQPWSAFDGDVRTSWEAQESSGWLRLNFGSTRDLGRVTIVPGLFQGQQAVLRVKTANGEQRIDVEGPEPRVVEIGGVSEILIRGKTADASNLSIAEVSSAGLNVSRPLVLPKTPDNWGTPKSVVLGNDVGGGPMCLKVQSIDRCRFDHGGWGEDGLLMDREFALNSSADFGLSLRVEPLEGVASDDILQSGLTRHVGASSTVNADIRSSASRVMDRDLKTGWISNPKDADPTLTMAWEKAKEVSVIRLSTAATLPATAPTAATLVFDNGAQRHVNFVDGLAEFAPVISSRVDVHAESDTPAYDYDANGLAVKLPIGVSELSLDGVSRDSVSADERRLTIPCGKGPAVQIGSQVFGTKITTSLDAFASGSPAEARLCGAETLTLESGTNRIRIAASETFRVLDANFSRSIGQDSPAATGLNMRDPTSAERTVQLPPDHGNGLLVSGQNENRGWEASTADKKLKAVRLNGWQQGWLVPADSGENVKQYFGPNRAYRWGMVAGVLSLLGLLALTLWRSSESGKPLAPGRVRSFGRAALVAGLLGATGVIGGSFFVALAVLGAVSTGIALHRRVASGWLAGGSLGVAVALYFLFPRDGVGTWAGDLALPQGFVAFALGALAASALNPRKSLNRRKGSSTPR